MSDQITVVIGGQPISVPTPLPFSALKRAWPAAKELLASAERGEVLDLVDAVSLHIRVLAGAIVALRPEMSVQKIEDTILPTEWQGLVEALRPILKASGLIKEKPPGEAPPGTDPAAAT